MKTKLIRLISSLMVFAMVLSLFAGMVPVSVQAADPKAQKKISVTEDELYNALMQAYVASKDVVSYSLATYHDLYQPAQNIKTMNCSQYVTWVYSYYLNELGYATEFPGAMPTEADWNSGRFNGDSVYKFKTWLEGHGYTATTYNTADYEADLCASLNVGDIIVMAKGNPNYGSAAEVPANNWWHILIYMGNGDVLHCTAQTDGDGGKKNVIVEPFANVVGAEKLHGKVYPVAFYKINELVVDNGSILIKKTDTSGTPLQDAEFTIVGIDNDNKDVNYNRKTEKDGTVVFNMLKLGKYVIYESNFPKGYGPADVQYQDSKYYTENLGTVLPELEGTPGWVVELKDGENIEIAFDAVNTKSNDIKITKVWQDNSNAEKKRPQSIHVQIQEAGTGKVLKTVEIGLDTEGKPLPGTTVSKDGNTWYFLYDSKQYGVLDPTKEYDIVEQEANQNGYTTKVDGYKITNTIPGGEKPEPGEGEVIYPVDNPPVFEMPSFEVTVGKEDKEGGFDNDIHTARGDATLAASYQIHWTATGGASGDMTLTSDEHGSYQTYSFAPWSSVGELEKTIDESATIPCSESKFGMYSTAVGYHGEVTVTIKEIVPEGYLPEDKSQTGTNARTYTFSYDMSASRTISPDVETEKTEGEGDDAVTTITHDGSSSLGPWTYSYTYNGSSVTGSNTVGTETTITGSSTQGSAHQNQSIGTATFVNRVQKNNYQLVKAYEEGLDPWNDETDGNNDTTVGQKDYIEDSRWTLRLLGEGSESAQYVQVVPVLKGEPGYSDFANVYRVVTDNSGTPADEEHYLSTSKYGQINILDLPYGKYVLQEIQSPATDGYVLETIYIDNTVQGPFGNDHETEDAPVLSNDAVDMVIRNTITVVKKDANTGKTVPMAGTAFRIRYMGNPNTEANGGDVTQDPNYGRYLSNGHSIDDGYQYVFYTDATGKLTIPYELEYGLYRLEEITAPEGYFIGKYDQTGAGSSTEGGISFDDAVAIYDSNGNKVDYTVDEGIIYNYYDFKVTEQSYEDKDEDGLADEGGVREIVVQIVEMTNNAVGGKIEILKLAEKLVGFKDSERDYGTVTEPVYEAQPLEGAVFDIYAAQDTTVNDGLDAPQLTDGAGNIIEPTLDEFNHLLWPDAERVESAVLPDGTEAYIVTTANTGDYDGNPESGDIYGEANKSNTITAKLLTAKQRGTNYELVYEVYTPAEDSENGVGYTTQYQWKIGLEYAAGGWNYSYVDLTTTVVADDYVSEVPASVMPDVQYGEVTSQLGQVAFAGDPVTIAMNDSSTIDLNARTNSSVTEIDQSVNLVPKKWYQSVTPVKNEFVFVPDTEALTLEVPEGYDTTESQIAGYYCYTNGTDYLIAVQEEDLSQSWMTIATPDLNAPEIIYANAPVIPEEYAGWALSDEEVVSELTDARPDAAETTVTETLFKLSDGTSAVYYLTDEEGNPIWLNIESMERSSLGWSVRVQELPEPYVMVVGEMNDFYLAMIPDDPDADLLVYVKVLGTGEMRWVPCDDNMDTYLTRTQTIKFDLNQAPESGTGFSFVTGGLSFSNICENEQAVAQIVNPSDSEPVITASKGAGCEVTVSEDGKTHTITAVQPIEGAYYVLADGSKVTVTYLGQYTKTMIIVPDENELPEISYNGEVQIYYDQLHKYGNTGDGSVINEQLVDLGNGNYIKAVYTETDGGYYTIEIVSDQTTKDGGFHVKYYDGRESASYVIQDGDVLRGQLDLWHISKTLTYASGAFVERVTSGADGVAVSSVLPLGTYYVREVDAGNGVVVNTESYQVDLTYDGQYVPLVWGAATVENDALNVTIDIAKSFQEAQGSDNYIYKAGAVFGVYNSDEITAQNTPSADVIMIDTVTATANSLMNIIRIGDDGYATTTLKLPFGKDYYIKELDTLEGFGISDTVYPFRVNELTIADKLTFAYDYDGISGEINQTDLFEATVVIDTLYQVPAHMITVNGTEVWSDTELGTESELTAGNAIISNTVYQDKSVLEIKAKSGEPTKIVFDNGATIMIEVSSDGYVAVFTDPTMEGVTGTVNTGSGVSSTTIKTEVQADGSTRYTYNPVVAYTGYTMDVTDTYVEPTTVLKTDDGILVKIVFDRASGKQLAVLEYPGTIKVPEYPALPYLTVDGKANTVTLDLAQMGSKTFAPILKYDTHVDDKGTPEDKTDDVEVKTPVYGETLVFTVDGDAFDVTVKGSGNVYGTGIQKDTLVVTKDADANQATVSFVPRTYTLTSERGGSAIRITLYHDSSFAHVTLAAGTITNAYNGAEPLVWTNGFDVLPGTVLTLKAADGVLYTVRLSKDGVLKAHAETIINGSLATGENAPHVSANGARVDLEFPGSTKTETGATVVYGETITYSRSSNTVTALEVKINSKSENHLTGNGGSGRPEGIPNDAMYVVFHKTDIYGTPLAGAEIAVYDESGREVFRGTTNEKGEVIWTEGVRAGVYTWKEVKAPQGYELDETEHTITIYEDGTVTGGTTVVNKKKPEEPGKPEEPDVPVTPPSEPDRVVIHKTDVTTAKPVPGAKIEVTDADGEVIFSGVTDANGDITFEKPKPGTYTFKEVVAPDGYYLNETEFTFTVNRNGSITGTTNITNTPQKTVTITKTDATDATGVPGAEITIYDETGKEVFKGITDENGHLEFPVPEVGKTYTFRETYAPDGYDVNETVFKFTVNEDGTVTGKTGIKDIRTGTVVISKIDVVDGKEIPGCEITIEDMNGNVVFKQVSDEYGKIYFYPPAPGTYRFYESRTVDGYYLNEESFTFTVDADGKITSGVTYLENVPVGTVVLKKTDIVDSKELPGAEITIWDAAGNEVFRGITDERGRVYFVALDTYGPGTYTFRETVAPNGYLLNTTTFTFTIDADGVIIGTTKITDERAPTTDVPKTGMVNWTIVFGGAAAVFTVIATAAYVCSKKRRNTEQ